jgi:hypothetical protein
MISMRSISGAKIGGYTGAEAKLGLRHTTLQSRMKKVNIERLFHDVSVAGQQLPPTVFAEVSRS